jgi:hypothetical protein
MACIQHLFPSKADLAKLRKIDALKVEDTTLSLNFKEWSPKAIDRWNPVDTWVCVKGCPYKRCCDYMPSLRPALCLGKHRK